MSDITMTDIAKYLLENPDMANKFGSVTYAFIISEDGKDYEEKLPLSHHITMAAVTISNDEKELLS